MILAKMYLKLKEILLEDQKALRQFTKVLPKDSLEYERNRSIALRVKSLCVTAEALIVWLHKQSHLLDADKPLRPFLKELATIVERERLETSIYFAVLAKRIEEAQHIVKE